ncbi:hypothetical protein GUITHDRAFT_117655 [Guillardia theta CCMP2712]|uniref:Uncharacterized protein n=1 Tax=Guillardia theta (strain CCMP2712) TaxID=905079 RepID=L1IJ56_GUITC|nr:hypothetical protein GUITHDRAFT_117655 [Guillardia theta CCMP2712]EKX36147.1 hypothetical protein GUITHDRAFT_117655 [Guillardia theta CCMP2712]|eukprot:XP_005823127.1 hypothetical protein GUITHDRAFT_117655 [Guillardia theta CCMP2712]
MTSELDLHIALDYMWDSRMYMIKVISKGDFKYSDILLLIKDNSTEHIHTRYPRETIILVEHEVEMFVEQRDMFRNFIRDMQERKAKLAPLFTALYNVDQRTWEVMQDVIRTNKGHQKVLSKQQIASLVMYSDGDVLENLERIEPNIFQAYTEMYNIISQIRIKLGMPFLPYKHPISPEYLLLHHLTPE